MDLEQVIQVSLAIIQTVTLIALIFYVVDTRKIARASQKSVDVARDTLNEMRIAREEETAPYIVVYFDIPIGEHLIYIVIKNLGKSIAENITFEFNPPLQCSDSRFLDQLNIISDGIGVMPPQFEYRTLFDTSIEYFNSDFPLIYRAKVSFVNTQNKNEVVSQQLLDISSFKGRMFVRQKRLEDLVDQVKKLNSHNDHLVKEIRKISSLIESGFWVRNTVTIENSENTNPEIWKSTVIGKLEEFTIFWRSAYGGRVDELYGSLLRELKSRAKVLSSHLIFLAGNRPNGSLAESSNILTEIAVKLLEIENLRLYADGGQSIRKLDELGNEIVERIEVIAGNLREPNTINLP